MPTLNDRQARFVDEYIACGMNATVAAKRAGYSERTAYSQGHDNLKKPEIRAAIDSRLAEAAMGANEVLARLTDIARCTLEDFLDITDEGEIYCDLAKAKAAGKLHLLKELAYSNKGQQIVKLHDPVAALEKLGRYHRLFDKPVEGADAGALEALREALRESPNNRLDARQHGS